MDPLESRLAPAALAEPPAIVSRDGRLEATLTMVEGASSIDGQPVTDAKTYNGVFAGVTLRAQPGDLLDLTLVNRLADEPSNLHTHGLHVSPVGDGDNPFLQIEEGQSNHYRIQIPADHPQGMYWYHPHEHGYVDDQISAGLSGMLVIGRPDGGAPELGDFGQVLLGLKALTRSGGDPAVAGLVTDAHYAVNGQIRPDLTMAPGEIKVWNVANLSLETNFRLELGGHRLHVVALDGNPLTQVRSVDFLDLVPGGRASFLVRADDAPGSYPFRTLAFRNGFNSTFEEELATLRVEGTPVHAELPQTLTPPTNPYEDLSAVTPVARRSITFQEDKTTSTYSVNGQTFPDVPLIVACLDTTEEWILSNDTFEIHPFHIHQNGFQVMSVNGRAVAADGTPTLVESVAPYVEGFSGSSIAGSPPQSELYLGGAFVDTVNVPARDPVTSEPGRVVIRMRFADFLGRFVYHCHIPFHEDHGMMGIVEVVPEAPTYAVAANAGDLPRVRVIDPATDRVVGDFLAFERSYRGGVNVAVADVNGDGVYDVIAGRNRGPGQVKVIDGTKLGRVDRATGVIRRDALLANRLAFGPGVRSGVFVAAGYFNADDRADVVAGSGAGSASLVRILDAERLLRDDPTPGRSGDRARSRVATAPLDAVIRQFRAFGARTRGGVRVAAGDVDGDGRVDLIAGEGPGGRSRVRVFSGSDWGAIREFSPYGSKDRGGVFLAAGNVNGAGYTDVITGSGRGPRAVVKVFAGASTATMDGDATTTVAAQAMAEVAAIPVRGRGFRGGVRVAAFLDPRALAPYGSSRFDVAATRAAGDGLHRTILGARPTAAPPGGHH